MLPKRLFAILNVTMMTLTLAHTHTAGAKGAPSPEERGIPKRNLKPDNSWIRKDTKPDPKPLTCDNTFHNKPVEYPERVEVPEEKRSWNAAYPDYKPAYYRSLSLKDPKDSSKDQPWADPENKFDAKDLNNQGIPKNPCGRTGIRGQGLLGKWGENWAADPVITRYDPKTGKLLVLLIKRKDGYWAIPGGMVDPGETKLSATAARELKEETGVSINMDNAKEIYVGMVDDFRNTDNSWMMTKVYHLHLDPAQSAKIAKQPLKAEDPEEISGIQWVPYDDKRLSNLFASHTQFIDLAFGSLPKDSKSPQAREAYDLITRNKDQREQESEAANRERIQAQQLKETKDTKDNLAALGTDQQKTNFKTARDKFLEMEKNNKKQ